MPSKSWPVGESVERRATPTARPSSSRSARRRASTSPGSHSRAGATSGLVEVAQSSAGWRCRRSSVARPRRRRSRDAWARCPAPATRRRCRRAPRTPRGARRGSRVDSRSRARPAMNSSRSISLAPAQHRTGRRDGSGERSWAIERAEATMTRGARALGNAPAQQRPRGHHLAVGADAFERVRVPAGPQRDVASRRASAASASRDVFGLVRRRRDRDRDSGVRARGGHESGVA